MASTRYLKEDLVLPLELDLLVVQSARGVDKPEHLEQLVFAELVRW
jgi:hypothetical protein